MAEEFQGGVCGGSWWSSSSRNVMGSSLCSSDAMNEIAGGFGWPASELFGMKTSRSSDESGSASDGSVVLQDVHNRPLNPEDSTLQMMNTTSDWNQALFQNNNNNGRSSRSESNYSCMLQADINTGMNYGQESGMDCPQTIQKDWSPRNYTTSVSEDSSTTNTFEPVIDNHQNFALNNHHHHHHQQQQQFSSTPTCQGLSTSFSMNSSSSSYGYPSNLLQTLFDDDVNTPQPPQKCLFQNQGLNFPENTNYFSSLEGFSSPKLSPMLKTSLPKQQLPFSGNTGSWNASAAHLNDMRGSSLSSTQLQMPSSTACSEKINLRNLTAKPNNEELVGKKTNDEPAFKRPRIETPSPLPTFKVRKEKLGDRITALQQLVSPFGKTDTASVLHEAIEYIKFLHDQVSAFSTPYLKNESPGQRQQTSADKIGDQDAPKQDLRSRGLCLVPISSTFPVAAETTTEFWAPSFGGAAFR